VRICDFEEWRELLVLIGPSLESVRVTFGVFLLFLFFFSEGLLAGLLVVLVRNPQNGFMLHGWTNRTFWRTGSVGRVFLALWAESVCFALALRFSSHVLV